MLGEGLLERRRELRLAVAFEGQLGNLDVLPRCAPGDARDGLFSLLVVGEDGGAVRAGALAGKAGGAFFGVDLGGA